MILLLIWSFPFLIVFAFKRVNFQKRLFTSPLDGILSPFTNVVQNSNQLLPPRDTHGGRAVTAEGGPAKIFKKIKGGGLLISLELIAIGCKHDAT